MSEHHVFVQFDQDIVGLSMDPSQLVIAGFAGALAFPASVDTIEVLNDDWPADSTGEAWTAGPGLVEASEPASGVVV